MSLLSEIEKYGLADCEFNRQIMRETKMNNERNEYVAIVMSRELLRFCKENDLPFDSADDLVMRNDLTDFQFGWLIGYCRIWEGLIE
jgi:hypothetical protein